MICAACRCPASISKSGLCPECRGIAHRPSGRQRRSRRTVQRWLRPEYRDRRLALGLTPEQTIRKAESILRELRTILPGRVIAAWGLDNPYMATHARRTMVSYILREHMRHAKKPVQSVRTSTRKAVAA